jgi:ATP-dependent Clp endopeptidase proteolytic subunit ClpP
VNVVQRTRKRVANLLAAQQRPADAGWYRVVRNAADAAAPTRVDIYDEIGGGGGWFSDPGVTAVDFVATLAQITGDLEIHINSPGGDVFEGLAIYNAIAQRPGNVVTIVDGLAASAASFIAMAGTQRIICPGAMMMIHDASGLCMGNAADMRELADLLDKVSENIAAIYQAHSPQSGIDWRAAMEAETWYTADEAVAAGLAHKLATRPAVAALAAAAKFDLSAYLHAPSLDAATGAQPADAMGSPYRPEPYRRESWENVQCPSCQKWVDDDSAYCGHCGTKLVGREDVKQDGDSGGDGSAQNAATVPVLDAHGHPLTNSSGVDESSWDGDAAMAAAGNSDDPAAAFKSICAGRREGDPKLRKSWALPHHKHAGDPPNADGVRNALSRLPQTEGLTNKSAAQAHLDAHMAVINPDRADDLTTLPVWLQNHLRDTHDPAELPAWLQPAEEAK